MSDPCQPAAKIGTGDFTGRVVSGRIPHAEPDSVVLRRLYPQPPVDIGVIDRIEAGSARLAIHPPHRSAWSDADRAALESFFTARYRDHHRLAALLGIADPIEESADGRS
ncbi:hypothetical protein K3N28_05260 [Glycomyces sp. TRM65418]|uniref:hypothetical protein n=1 Tax=Glycomyces sp. TRM65418 TaxID=2867006 RepID=UPI001CE50CC3|nr:hypothetical protein [Glycomyces sp. TRM65418]MCC3762476.1 hypothetical protein [Glycomyces sp. TRM65418]QZD56520.1 hypothetical protein K3N28_05220 [Glycomyces sp. TRM65418]